MTDALLHPDSPDGPDDPDGAWALLEEFDRRARRPDDPPGAALFDALHEHYGAGLVTALAFALGRICVEGDQEPADTYADQLLLMAARWGGDAERALTAAVDVTLAELCLRNGDRAGARLRIDRCRADLTESVPELLGDHALLLAWIADDEDDVAGVRGHGAAACELFAEWERWVDAAMVAEVVAETFTAPSAELVAGWCGAADLYAAADRSQDARRCVERAVAETTMALDEPGTVAGPAQLALFDRLRRAAAAHDMDLLAVQLGLSELALATETDLPWSDLVALHERARREFAQVDDPAEREAGLGRADMMMGRAAVVHGRGTQSRPLLERALPALRTAGLTEDVDACASMLAVLAGEPAPATTVGDPGVRTAARLAEGVRLAGERRFDEALAVLRQAAEDRADAGRADVPGDITGLLISAVTAAVRVGEGGPDAGAAARAALGDIDERLAGTPLPRSAAAALDNVAGTLRALLAPRPSAAEPEPDRGAETDAEIARLLADSADGADAPGRAERATRLVETVTWDGNRTIADLPLGFADLVEIGDGCAPPPPRWTRTRVAARLQLLGRELAERSLPDPDDAVPRLEALAAEAAGDPALVPLVAGARLALNVAQQTHHGGALPSDASESFRSIIEAVPAGHPLAEAVRAMLDRTPSGLPDAAALARLAELGPNLPDGLRREVDDLLAAAGPLLQSYNGERVDDATLQGLRARADQTGPDPAVSARAHTAVAAAALRGGEEQDPQRVELAIQYLRRALGLTPTDGPQLVFDLVSLAVGLLRRAELLHTVDGLAEARTVLERARAEADGPHHPMWQILNEMLADVRRRLGDVRDAHRAAVEGMRGHVWRVLSEPDLAGATEAVRYASRDAMDTAVRCLHGDDPEGAIASLDAGRGLALFAATAAGGFAERLAAVDPDLEKRWRAAVHSGDPTRTSPDLRRSVLRVLTADGDTADLLDPPGVEEIRTALRTTDADALVYLVPASAAGPGFAVCAPAVGDPRFVLLPDLAPATADLGRTLAGLGRDLHVAAPSGPDPDASTTDTLDELCRWAWTAAVGDLLQALYPGLTAAGPPPRLILVPMGDLARVPWQAARRPSDGRYALELVAISQVASARMLCRTAGLKPVAISSCGLVVSDPDTGGEAADLAAARREALAIRQTYYPGARFVGRRPDGTLSPSGSGTRAQLGAWLTDTGPAAGSVCHLACHGVIETGGRRPSAYLLLADGGRLPAEEIVALMASTPERRIALAVLAACHTGRAMTGYDEAYSLGTAFLAAGVRTVLSTQWAIPDDETSVLMYVFHHFLRDRGLPAWAALREAQLWMLRPDPATTDDVPEPLRDLLDRSRAGASGRGSVLAWAAFVHWGW